MSISSKNAANNIKSQSWPHTLEDGILTVEAPGGYKFLISDKEPSTKGNDANLILILVRKY